MKKYIGLVDSTFKERHSNDKRDLHYGSGYHCPYLASITDFNVIFVKYHVVLVITRRLFLKMPELSLTYINFNILTKWWIRPDNIFLSISPSWSSRHITKFSIESTFPKSIVSLQEMSDMHFLIIDGFV